MREYINIGPSPSDEDCIQVGTTGYSELARAECERFIKLIRKKLGPELGEAKLVVKSFPHDFGSYLEVCCTYQDGDEAGIAYAFECEREAPTTWDDDGGVQ